MRTDPLPYARCASWSPSRSKSWMLTSTALGYSTRRFWSMAAAVPGEAIRRASIWPCGLSTSASSSSDDSDGNMLQTINLLKGTGTRSHRRLRYRLSARDGRLRS